MADQHPTEGDAMKTRRGLTAIDAALALIGVILVLQMALLTSTLDLYLGGHEAAALTGAIASGILFLLNAALTFFIMTVDAGARGI